MALGSIDTIARQLPTSPQGFPVGRIPFDGGNVTPRSANQFGAGVGYAPQQEGAYGSSTYDWGAYGQGMAQRWNQNPQYGRYNAQQTLPPTGMSQSMFDFLQARLANGSGDLRQDFGDSMQGLGLDRQGLGISRGAAQRGIRNTRQEERIARGLYNNSQLQANSDAGQEVRQARSTSTASGAMSAPGIRNDLGNIYGNLVFQRERNTLGFQRDLLGIRENRATYRDQLRNLQLEAQRLGLQEDDYRQALRRGLRDLRLDTTISVNDLTGSLNSQNAQNAQVAQQILQAIYQSLGIG